MGELSMADKMAMFNKISPKAQPTKATVSPKAQPLTASASPKVQSAKPSAMSAAPKKATNEVKGSSADAINFELKAAFGKPFSTLTMAKVEGMDFSGSIPLVLLLLGTKLEELDRFGSLGMFNPKAMESAQGDAKRMEMAYAHNIFAWLCALPQPLLGAVPQSVLNKAINRGAMQSVAQAMGEPLCATICYLWHLMARVAMSRSAQMTEAALGKVFGPLCCLVTQSDMKGNRVSGNVLAASRMVAMFRRGIEWRMEVLGFDHDADSDSDSD